MPRSVKACLTDIKDAIAGIEGIVIGMTFAEYQSSWRDQRAVERGLEIISEASRRIPDSIKVRYPHLPWHGIASIGNHLRHEYQHIDPEIIWEIATVRLGRLSRAVADALKDFEEPT